MRSREEKIRRAIALLENNLELVGLTGVEDRLQDNIQETLEAVRHAGIRVGAGVVVYWQGGINCNILLSSGKSQEEMHGRILWLQDKERIWLHKSCKDTAFDLEIMSSFTISD